MTAAMRPQGKPGHTPSQIVPRKVIAGRDPRLKGQGPLRELAEEVPVAMVFNGSSLAVMMATPDDIQDFATGFAFSEGVVQSLDELEDYEQVAHENGIEARFWLPEDRATQLADRRRALAGPIGCGLCGIDSLSQALRKIPALPSNDLTLSAKDVNDAARGLRASQPLHDRCRALHAAGFFLPGTGLVLAREDVGRHNALDKLIGAMRRQGMDPATGAIVMTSRISVDLVQKTALTGCPVLISASAPTAHGVRLAEEAGLAVAAFAKGDGFEIYSRPERFA